LHDKFKTTQEIRLKKSHQRDVIISWLMKIHESNKRN